MAWVGHWATQAMQSMQSWGFVTTALSPCISKVLVGQTETQIPSPVHFEESIITVGISHHASQVNWGAQINFSKQGIWRRGIACTGLRKGVPCG